MFMKRFLIYRDNVLFTRTLTLVKAKRLCAELRAKGFQAGFAEAIEEVL